MLKITNLRSIYIATLGDAVLAYEVMQEFYGDCELRQDAQGEYHLTAPHWRA